MPTSVQDRGVLDLENVSATKLVKLRRRYDSERRAYFDQVSAIVTALQDTGAENRESIEAFLSDRACQFAESADAYHRVLRGLGVQTAYGLLHASFAMPVTDLIGTYLRFDQPLSLAIAGVAGAVSISGVLHKTHLDLVRKRIAKPAAFYLYQIQRRLI